MALQDELISFIKQLYNLPCTEEQIVKDIGWFHANYITSSTLRDFLFCYLSDKPLAYLRYSYQLEDKRIEIKNKQELLNNIYSKIDFGLNELITVYKKHKNEAFVFNEKLIKRVLINDYDETVADNLKSYFTNAVLFQLPEQDEIMSIEELSVCLVEAQFKFYQLVISKRNNPYSCFHGLSADLKDYIKINDYVLNHLDINKFHNRTQLLCFLIENYDFKQEQRQILIEKIYKCFSRKTSNINYLNIDKLSEEEYTYLKPLLFVKKLQTM